MPPSRLLNLELRIAWQLPRIWSPLRLVLTRFAGFDVLQLSDGLSQCFSVKKWANPHNKHHRVPLHIFPNLSLQTAWTETVRPLAVVWVIPEISLSSYDEFLPCLLDLSCITSDRIQLLMSSFGHRLILSQSGVPFPSKPTNMSVVIAQKILKSCYKGDGFSAEPHEALLESSQGILPQTLPGLFFFTNFCHWGWQIIWPKLRLPTESFSSHEPTPDTSCKYEVFLS